jgi:hypothetical protein
MHRLGLGGGVRILYGRPSDFHYDINNEISF